MTLFIETRPGDLTSPEPLVACETCGHFPCPFCGPNRCDEFVETSRRPRSAVKIEESLSHLKLDREVNPRVRFCDGCGEKFSREGAGARVEYPDKFVAKKTIIFWFCAEACARKWCAEDEVDFDPCSCSDKDSGCAYASDGHAQNGRVIAWAFSVMPEDSTGGSCGTLADGYVVIRFKTPEDEDTIP